MQYDADAIRSQFPALANRDGETPRIYFDNPAGTQVPQSVVDRMSECMLECSANVGGYFRTSESATAIVADAHIAMADLLNASSADEIVFGQNMTTITLHISRSIGRQMQAGDEIILTRMDHDANVQPWVLLARDLGLEVKWLPFDLDTFEFDLSLLDDLLSDKTKLVCVGGASNLTGTINEIRTISKKARDAGAWTFVDAVQSVPHVSTDVQELGCDFLVCSAYKFFGPHQGILWGRRDVLEQLEAYKVRPAPDELPGCFETGTQSHEGMAGTTDAVDYFAWVGETFASRYQEQNEKYEGRRRHVHAAMDCLFDYETALAMRLIDGLQQLPCVRIQGITAKDAMARRVPTVAFTVAGVAPSAIAESLARKNIFVWSGHNYAVELAMALGIYDAGGAVRVGPVHYNNKDEIDFMLNALDEILPRANVA
jgi:cysteine desulfurase family protein (TIGR01976 family)